MHVVQPYPTMLKPSSARYSRRPDALWYSVTISEPGRQARLDPRLHFQAALHGVAREQPRADHHARIRRVGAAGDRRDDDRAVDRDPPCPAQRSRQLPPLPPPPGAGCGGVLPRLRPRAGFRLALREHHLERLLELDLRLAQRHAVLRTLRAGKARLDGREIQLERRGVDRIRRSSPCGRAPAPSRTPRPASRAPRPGRSGAGSRASSSSIGQMAIVAPYSGDMLPSVARSAIVRNSRPGP